MSFSGSDEDSASGSSYDQSSVSGSSYTGSVGSSSYLSSADGSSSYSGSSLGSSSYGSSTDGSSTYSGSSIGSSSYGSSTDGSSSYSGSSVGRSSINSSSIGSSSSGYTGSSSGSSSYGNSSVGSSNSSDASRSVSEKSSGLFGKSGFVKPSAQVVKSAATRDGGDAVASLSKFSLLTGSGVKISMKYRFTDITKNVLAVLVLVVLILNFNDVITALRHYSLYVKDNKLIALAYGWVGTFIWCLTPVISWPVTFFLSFVYFEAFDYSELGSAVAILLCYSAFWTASIVVFYLSILSNTRCLSFLNYRYTLVTDLRSDLLNNGAFTSCMFRMQGSIPNMLLTIMLGSYRIRLFDFLTGLLMLIPSELAVGTCGAIMSIALNYNNSFFYSLIITATISGTIFIMMGIMSVVSHSYLTRRIVHVNTPVNDAVY